MSSIDPSNISETNLTNINQTPEANAPPISDSSQSKFSPPVALTKDPSTIPRDALEKTLLFFSNLREFLPRNVKGFFKVAIDFNIPEKKMIQNVKGDIDKGREYLEHKKIVDNLNLQDKSIDNLYELDEVKNKRLKEIEKNKDPESQAEVRELNYVISHIDHHIVLKENIERKDKLEKQKSDIKEAPKKLEGMNSADLNSVREKYNKQLEGLKKLKSNPDVEREINQFKYLIKYIDNLKVPAVQKELKSEAKEIFKDLDKEISKAQEIIYARRNAINPAIEALNQGFDSIDTGIGGLAFSLESVGWHFFTPIFTALYLPVACAYAGIAAGLEKDLTAPVKDKEGKEITVRDMIDLLGREGWKGTEAELEKDKKSVEEEH